MWSMPMDTNPTLRPKPLRMATRKYNPFGNRGSIPPLPIAWLEILMNEYIKTYGEPGERKVRIHIGSPGMDVAICGLDAVGDELVHNAPPEYLPFGKKYRVTCEHCQRIIEAVKDHISANATMSYTAPKEKP